MYKLKVGIPIAEYDIHGGGSFSYATQLTEAIDDYNFSSQLEIVFIDFTGKKENKFNKSLLSFHPFKKFSFNDALRKIVIQFLKKVKINAFKKILYRCENNHALKRNKYIAKKLKQEEISVLFYITPGGNDFDYPFLTTHWDIGHRSTYMFPEFIDSFDYREYYYASHLKKALYILTETYTGKKELIKYTKINEDRIDVMPIFPSTVIYEEVGTDSQIQFLDKVEITSKKFFLYPAQFWGHKNHTLLIDAFSRISYRELGIKLVFTGSDKGNLGYIKKYVSTNSIQDYVIFLGFVSNKELYTLYKNAAALVMPTYLGPSNMPPLEAANLGCPVIISDLEGHREIMGDYAEYFKTNDVDELKDKLIKVLTLPKEQPKYLLKTFNIENTIICLEKSLINIIPIRKTWE